jgi:hypothetical protein
MLSDTAAGGSNQLKRDDSNTTELQLHTSVISITSISPSAADAFTIIYNVLTVDPDAILPYTFSSFVLNGVCATSGEV